MNLTAELSLHVAEGQRAILRFSESAVAFSLDQVLVPGRFRAQGHGSFLVRRLLALADLVGKPVLTTARPIGQNSPAILARLVAYYERFGFRVTQRGLTAVHMRRPLGGEADGERSEG